MRGTLCVAPVEAGLPAQSPVTPPGVFLHCLFLCVCLCALPGVRVCVTVSVQTLAGWRGRAAAGRGLGALSLFWPCLHEEVLPAARPAVGLPHRLTSSWSLVSLQSQCPEDWRPIGLFVPSSWHIPPNTWR